MILEIMLQASSTGGGEADKQDIANRNYFKFVVSGSKIKTGIHTHFGITRLHIH